MGTKSILSISLIAVLLIGVVSFDDSFADHKPGHSSSAGGVPYLQTQVDTNTASIDSFFDVWTEISVHDADIAEVDGHVTVLKEQVDTNTASIDSFFDITTDLQNQIDSFFDVFFDVTEDGTRNTPDSFFDIFTVGETTPDSFFDVFVEIDARDKHFDTEILSMDLRGQSCPPNEFVVGVDDEGIVCKSISTSPPIPVLELCNEIDDDSDPTTLDGIDETWFGQSCDGPDTDSCSEGVFMCTAGGQVCSDTTDDSEEIPGDGRDNDCDGEIDEVPFVDVSGTWTIESPVNGLRGICSPSNALLPNGSFSVSEIIFDQRIDSTQVTFQLSVGIEELDIFHVPQETVFPVHLYPAFDLRTDEFALSGTFPDESHVSGQIRTGEIPFPTPLGTYTCKPIISSFAASR